MSRRHKSNYHKKYYERVKKDGWEQAKKVGRVIIKGTGRAIGDIAGTVKKGVVAGYRGATKPRVQQFFKGAREGLSEALPPVGSYEERVSAAQDEIAIAYSQGRGIQPVMLARKYQLPEMVILKLADDLKTYSQQEYTQPNREEEEIKPWFRPQQRIRPTLPLIKPSPFAKKSNSNKLRRRRNPLALPDPFDAITGNIGAGDYGKALDIF